MMQVLQHLLYHIFIILIQSYTFSGWVRSVRSESAHMGCLKANQKWFVLQFGGLFLVFNFCAGELGWKDCVFVHQVFTNSITSIDHQSLWAVSTHTDNQSLIKWMLLAAVAVSSHAVCVCSVCVCSVCGCGILSGTERNRLECLPALLIGVYREHP